MATRSYSVVQTPLHQMATTVEWAGLLAGDDGQPLLMAHYGDKCLHIFGTFGGATVGIEGSNEDTLTAPNDVGLTDPTQTLIALTGKGIKQILENPLWIRPKVTGGDGTTSLTARLVCRV